MIDPKLLLKKTIQEYKASTGNINCLGNLDKFALELEPYLLKAFNELNHRPIIGWSEK